MANDIERAARDAQYRLDYENEQRQKEFRAEAERRQKLREEEERRGAQQRAQTSSDEQSKVICTELNRQGLLRRSDYLLSLRYVREHLAPRHERGYHAWAVPAVLHMRRSSRATAVWSRLARARADHIAFVYGDRSRRNRVGALLCALFAAGCWIIGGFVGEQDWRGLYRDSDRKKIPSI